MREIVFFLEEESSKVLLQALIPRVLDPAPNCKFIVFEGKQDLEKRLVRRMKGYLVPNAQFVVLRDQDSEDCLEIKNTLKSKCAEGNHPESLVRIACRELESWYLADLRAVEIGLSTLGLQSLQEKKRFRNPDFISSPARELIRVAPSYQKIGGSRLIGPHLDIENTRSTSFRHFIDGIRRLAVVS